MSRLLGDATSQLSQNSTFMNDIIPLVSPHVAGIAILVVPDTVPAHWRPRSIRLTSPTWHLSTCAKGLTGLRQELSLDLYCLDCRLFGMDLDVSR